MQCSVCGGHTFINRQVLWPALISDWQLSPEEANDMNRQQGEVCTGCGANLRSIALADALRAYMGTQRILLDALREGVGRDLSILEINEAGSLTPVLRQFAHYKFGAYPDVDMHATPYPDATFDLVIHSDTLEHVAHPIHALAECRRILKPGGAICFTVPTVVGRMSRDRAGLPKSYHGNAATSQADWAVETEFGADAWTYVMRAGFTEVTLHAVAYPAAIAYLARKAGG